MRRYYHLTREPLQAFRDRTTFGQGRAQQPRGLYCTQWPERFIAEHMYYDVCHDDDTGAAVACRLYAVEVPADRFTEDPARADPERILRVTRRNWRAVADYMRGLASANDLCRDFAGLDADDPALYAFLQERAMDVENMAASYDPGHQDVSLRHLFPYGFSGLALDQPGGPEACIWRGAAWLRIEEVAGGRGWMKRLWHAPLTEAQKEAQREVEQRSNWFRAQVFPADAWISARTLQRRWRRDRGTRLPLREAHGMMIYSEYDVRVWRGALWMLGGRMRSRRLRRLEVEALPAPPAKKT